MKPQQRCNIAQAVVFFVFMLVLGYASYVAVNAMHDPWRAVDYWLAWFSVFSLLGSIISGVVFGIAVGSALNCDQTGK